MIIPWILSKVELFSLSKYSPLTRISAIFSSGVTLPRPFKPRQELRKSERNRIVNALLVMLRG